LEVRDTGIGIPADKLQTIFQPFIQADSTVTRKYGGTGLGLAISRRIAQALGGDLSVESIVGRGSSFVATVNVGDMENVRIASRPPAEQSGDVKQESTASTSLNGSRVLLVDDGETNRKLISVMLSRADAIVEMAENGALAVHAVQHGRFDVILMDMQMPVMDGYSATRRIRELGYQGPIIALTAHAMKGDREKCEAAGCSGYLSKPVNMDQLIATLRQITAGGKGSSTQYRGAEMVSSKTLRSTLPTDDPDIREIVQEFVDSVPERIEAMSAALATNQYEELARLAHSLKGCGGTAGFHCFTQPAGEIEQLAKANDGTKIEAALDELREFTPLLTV
jgi:CheY-like chemotaxis protein/HPt (histidine-containing phosphotransfer) domain-containing protein